MVWYSDDGGVNWTGPSTVAQNAGGTTWKLDKPSVAVSWYSGTLGHVYVAYMNIDDRFGATVHYLRLARSTDGGLCFGYRDQNGNCVRQSYDVAIDNVGTPFCVVSSATGYIYVWWTNHTNEEIRVGRSTDGGVNWNHEVVASGDLLGPSDPVIGDIFGKQTRAFTIPMGRYNSVAGKLVVVWHERQGDFSLSGSVPSSRLTGFRRRGIRHPGFFRRHGSTVQPGSSNRPDAVGIRPHFVQPRRIRHGGAPTRHL